MNLLGNNETVLKKITWKQLFAMMTSIVIVALMITAIPGVFGKNIYVGFAPAKYVQESRAQDLITLILGVPLLGMALFGVLKERTWAYPLCVGVLAYELYVYLIYTLGAIYNPLFPFYVLITGMCIYSMIAILSKLDKNDFQNCVNRSMPRRWIAFFFLALVIVFAFVWISQVAASIQSGIADSGHFIFVIDLAVVLPAFAIAAVHLLQKTGLGDVLAGMLLIKFDSLCISISLGQLFRAMNQISVESGLLFIFIPFGLISLILTGLYFINLKIKE